MTSYEDRLALLHASLLAHDHLAIAFSGGVDSSVLVHVAHAVMGDRMAAVLADSPSLPRRELHEAREFAATHAIPLAVLHTTELALPAYRANQGDRCYHCRHTLFQAMAAWARTHDFTALAYGEITDDLRDERPGRRAAREFRVVTPLADAGFSKDDVRRYARERDLSPADKPASACLASRIPVGTAVTAERLHRIEAAEERVRGLGFGLLRVRDHGRRARVEVAPDELERARAHHDDLATALAELAFEELELAAYASPSAGRSAARLPVPPAPGS